jgi:DNA-binding NtrC family response regulator
MRSYRVLVIDDEIGIRELIRDVLIQDGHEVVCAENGVEAMAMLAGNKTDAIFLDIRMPRGDGLTTLRAVRSRWPDMPVVIITGCGQNEVIEEAMKLGAIACLKKPFGISDIVGMLEYIDASQDQQMASAQ